MSGCVCRHRRHFAICPSIRRTLNPIEMPFSKLKADLRKAAERTIPRLRRRIRRFAHTLTGREASKYFKHANRPESALADAEPYAGKLVRTVQSGPGRSQDFLCYPTLQSNTLCAPGKPAGGSRWEFCTLKA